MERKTNWLAVAACIVAGMVIGFLWYGMLFQDTWCAGNGITMEGDKFLKNGVEMSQSATPMLINAVSLLVYALLINWLLGRAGAGNWMDGAKVGGIVGLLMAIGIFTGNTFAADPAGLSMVDGSYSLVLFTVIGAILGGPQKK